MFFIKNFFSAANGRPLSCTGRERDVKGKGARKERGTHNEARVALSSPCGPRRTSCSAQSRRRGGAGPRVLGCRARAGDERASQLVASRTGALPATESKDRRIHLFNFCFKKHTSNDTTENKEETLWCNKMY